MISITLAWHHVTPEEQGCCAVVEAVSWDAASNQRAARSPSCLLMAWAHNRGWPSCLFCFVFLRNGRLVFLTFKFLGMVLGVLAYEHRFRIFCCEKLQMILENVEKSKNPPMHCFSKWNLHIARCISRTPAPLQISFVKQKKKKI